MRRTILLLTALMCCCISAIAQPNPAKPAEPKTQKAEGPRRQAVHPPGSRPNGLYSPAIVVGELVFTAGQIGIDPKTGQLAEGFNGQFEQVFRNLTAALEAAGSDAEHILKATVFLADMADYNAMNELYRAKFKGDPPARTTVQVAALPRGARVEIEAIAIVKKK